MVEASDRQNAELLDKIFESTEIIAAVLDCDFNFIRVSRAYAAADNRTPEFYPGKNHFDFYPSDAEAIFRRVVETGEEYTARARPFVYAEHPERGISYWDWTLHPVKEKDGRVTTLIFILKNVTREKETELALEESEERLRSITTAARDALILLNEKGEVVYWNPAAERILGYTSEEIRGKIAHHILVPPRFLSAFEAGWPRFQETGEGPVIGKTLELSALHKDGREFPVELSVSALKIRGKWHAVGIIRDITERKKNEERIVEEGEVSANLLRIAEAAARTADIDHLMENTLLLSHQILKPDLSVSYLWDPETRVFVPSRAFGLPSSLLPGWRNRLLEGTDPIVQETIQKEEPSVISEIPGDLRLLPDLHTGVLVPLIGKKGKLGLLGFLRRTPWVVTDRDLRILRGIGHQLSASLEEARLFKASLDQAMRLSHQMETIRVMADIDRSILSAREPDEILETAVRMAARVVPCDEAAVYLADSKRMEFDYRAGFGTTLPKRTLIPYGKTCLTEVLRNGRPQYLPNLAERKELPELETRLLEDRFRSLLRIPLWVGNEGVGILGVASRRPAAFSPEDVSTLEKFGGQVSVALSNARLLIDLRELFTGTVRTLSEAIDAKSPWTRGHSDRVAELAVLIAREMNRPEKEIEDLRIAGWLHDIGKIATYESILEKPERLTPEEYAFVKEHTIRGVQILSSIPQIAHLFPWIRGHHEWWNGNGYPDGLREESIPLQARILAVADSYDSMTAERPYRATPGKEWAVEELKRFSGIQFDSQVVEAFLKKVFTL